MLKATLIACSFAVVGATTAANFKTVPVSYDFQPAAAVELAYVSLQEPPAPAPTPEPDPETTIPKQAAVVKKARVPVSFAVSEYVRKLDVQPAMDTVKSVFHTASLKSATEPTPLRSVDLSKCPCGPACECPVCQCGNVVEKPSATQPWEPARISSVVYHPSATCVPGGCPAASDSVGVVRGSFRDFGSGACSRGPVRRLIHAVRPVRRVLGFFRDHRPVRRLLSRGLFRGGCCG